MPVLFKLFQDNRKNSTKKGCWYARAIHNGTIDTAALAKQIEEMCTVTEPDIIAVLNALVRVMTRELQNSMRVKLDGFGSFKIGLRTKPAEEAADFNAQKNINGMKVNFMPEVHFDKNRRRIVTFLDGSKVQETAKNDVVTDKNDNEDAEGEGAGA